ncbi:hypothetical protein SAMN05216559_2499 [Halomicrobium zhouii]|uniref:DUF7984 domain-containing protein n=1 Tax=Halomicrobium zhouii TaxID=767519 RepID=A0A1I6LD71_9EURY|nr:hypothetical protein [Halomicrobium zhouii]SFS01442.1 hypothetical protein SAMN05216559_2499 [Halomicrobium zhouii]
MHVTRETVRDQRNWVAERTPVVTDLINETRAGLGDHFDVDVDTVTVDQVDDAVDAVFTDGDRAVNVAAMIGILRDLDVEGDYPGFVVDELIGRELAATIAGDQPLRLLAEATFHYADVRTHGDPDDPADGAGLDDLDAALAAGFQTRLPGWPWRERPSPFRTGTE